MANYKLVDTDQLDADLKTVADAIREKGGTTDQLAFPDGMASAVEAIQAGGGDEPTPPADGKTRIYISLREGRTSPMLGCCPNGTVTVDWGDGTTPDTLTGTSTSSVKWTPTHNYAEAGDYVITLSVDGEVCFSGQNKSYAFSYILRHGRYADPINLKYINSVKMVALGSGAVLDSLAFSDCRALKRAFLSNYVGDIGSTAFQNCNSLLEVAIPDSVTSIGGSAFYYCTNLSSVTIGNGVTSIGDMAFYYCFGLERVKFPSGVNFIGSSAFNSCGARQYDFTACTSVPTMSNTNAFSNIPSDCEFLIPAALFDEWSNATNWTTYASKMVAV